MPDDETLKVITEALFQRDMKLSPWYGQFMDRYGEAPNLNAPEYDMRKAWGAGVIPQPDPYDNNFLHWPSSLPTGEMLKSPDHPTAWKEHYMRQTGQNSDAIGATMNDWMKIKK